MSYTIQPELKKDPDTEKAAEAAYLVLRNYQDLAWTWNHHLDKLSAGMSGPTARRIFSLITVRINEWLMLASDLLPLMKAQGLPGASDKLRSELADNVTIIEAAIEKVKVVREDAIGIREMRDVPMPSVSPEQLAEAEELYNQGRFVDFKEANARRDTGRQ
ncbi:MAG: hypothetical protein ACRELG_07765 [Gemmataceae bacterium]